MEKEIKIIPPEGYEIDKEKSTFEKIVFKKVKKEITYSKILESILENHKEYYKGNAGFFGIICKAQLDSLVSLHKLCNVAKYLNGDWLPNWEDMQEDKYFIDYNYNNTGFSVGKSFVNKSSHVYFKTDKYVLPAIQILGEEEIRKALTLNH